MLDGSFGQNLLISMSPINRRTERRLNEANLVVAAGWTSVGGNHAKPETEGVAGSTRGCHRHIDGLVGNENGLVVGREGNMTNTRIAFVGRSYGQTPAHN